jgi:exopolyphosphatase / guanosine-5'-triphosphate,3'-diphosphate pyrophosphatase
VDEATVTKLGQGVHGTRRFHSDAMARMEICFKEYSQLIKRENCQKVVAVATSAARDVSNGVELLELGKQFDIPIQIISGEREAELTFKGAIFDQGKGDGIAVVDVGGGSTEIILPSGGSLKSVSVDVGSVRLTELYVTSHPTPSEQLLKVEAHIRNAFAAAEVPVDKIKEVVAVAGTPTTLAAVDQAKAFSEKLVHGYGLSLSKIEQWIDRLGRMSVGQREQLPGMQPKRSDVIVTGSQILAGALRAMKQSKVLVSTKGLRYGVALSWQEL